MKFLKKLKSGNFWVSLISAGVLIAEGIFDFELKTEYLNQILLGLMGIMTLFGIVSDHGDNSVVISNPSSESNASIENTNVSNIKSICDTVSLLLNKVSINSNLEKENVNEISEMIKDLSTHIQNVEPEKKEIVENFEQKKEEIIETENVAVEEKEPLQEDIEVVEETVKEPVESLTEISIVK